MVGKPRPWSYWMNHGKKPMSAAKTPRELMASNSEAVKSFIDTARSVGLKDETIESILDMDMNQLVSISGKLGGISQLLTQITPSSKPD
jgi:hypothetical protein